MRMSTPQILIFSLCISRPVFEIKALQSQVHFPSKESETPSLSRNETVFFSSGEGLGLIWSNSQLSKYVHGGTPYGQHYSYTLELLLYEYYLAIAISSLWRKRKRTGLRMGLRSQLFFLSFLSGPIAIGSIAIVIAACKFP